MSRFFANTIIIHYLKRGIGVSVDIAVKNYYRYTFIIYFFDNGRDSVGFIGRGNDYVKVIVKKISYVGYLLLITVIGRTDLNICFGMKHDFTIDLIVHFCAPVVLTALRNANAVMLVLTTTYEGKKH